MTLEKRVVYIVIDGLNVDALEQAIGTGRAPALSFLKDRSSYVRDSVAVFPTITPAATASLVTGEVPSSHRIPGMCWYDRDAERFVNYGQSPRAAVVEGMKQIVQDALFNLNCRHLSPNVETIHEVLGKMGLVTSSINFMIFRGPHMHDTNPNLVEKMLLRKAIPERLPGPKEHYFADVIVGPAHACDSSLPKKGLEKRMKATDGFAACVTRGLLEKEAADMILFYLHENDHISHKSGPSSQVDNVADADAHIAYVLDTYGSWEETVDKVGFVLTADHSQTPISDEDDHIVDFTEVLNDFSQIRPKRGKEKFEDKDVAVAGNGRVLFTYLNQDRRETLLPQVASTLMQSDAVDQVMWRDGDAYVVDSERGRVRFWQADGTGDTVVDERENKWAYQGDLGAVSGVIEDGRIRTPEYPLAMWRIKSALDLDRMGDIVSTMKLTYEAIDLGGGDHRGGGDHASLHVQDSLVPFMSTLADPPLRPTTVDVMPHIVRHFKQSQ